MTNRERVLSALRHAGPDRVPYHVGLTYKARERMVEFTGDPDFDASWDNCLCFLDIGLPDGWKEVERDIWQDEFGVRWNRAVDKDIGVVCNQIVRPDTLAGYRFPDSQDPRRLEQLEKWRLSANRERFTVVNIGFSLFERAWTLVGMEELLTYMVLEPSFVHRLLDEILEFNLALIEKACGYEIDAMMFGDDWGDQRGLIMGPDLWRRFIRPRIAKMYEAVRKRGKFVFIHSCGKVDCIFPDLIDVGVDVFNPFQPEVMDVAEMKRRFGGRLSFYGGISTQRLLPFGSEEDVRREVRLLLDTLGRNGGYIAAPAHAVPGDAKPENILAMMDALNRQ